MTLSTYPEYKDSGVSWLGDLPAHWVKAPLKTFVESDRRITYGIVQAGPDTPGGIPYIRPADMSDEAGVLDKGKALRTTPEIADSYRRSAIRVGDLVCSIGPSFGKLMVVPDWLDGGNLTQGTARIAVSNENHPKFVFWALRSGVSVSQWEAGIGGATFRALNLEPLANTWLAKPPRDEQVAIAVFLDRETAKIDALIAEQEKLLALLAEKRQATISHAVTRGLDPHAPMKDSGIPWLGEVPAHWRVTRCGRFISILSGFAFPSAGFDHSGSGTRLLRGANVSVGALRWDDVVYWERSPNDRLDEYELKVGDLVIGMDRPLIAAGMRVARVQQSDVPCLLLQRVALLRTAPDLSSQFLMHYLSTPMFVAHFSPETTGVSVPHISPDQISAFVITIPSVDEQERIVEHLEREIARLNLLEAQSERAIVLLKEHRTALIAAAVTGQIDVRGLVDAERAA